MQEGLALQKKAGMRRLQVADKIDSLWQGAAASARRAWEPTGGGATLCAVVQCWVESLTSCPRKRVPRAAGRLTSPADLQQLQWQRQFGDWQPWPHCFSYHPTKDMGMDMDQGLIIVDMDSAHPSRHLQH